MFIIHHENSNRNHISNDIDTAADVLYGLTGREEDYTKIKNIMANMNYGDIFVGDTYEVLCKEDE